MKYLLTAAACCLALPAMAQQVNYTCIFTEACRQMGGNCQPEDDVYNYEFDLGTGAGAMLVGGSRYTGEVHQAEGALHFIFLNSAGAEMTSISEGGEILYAGTLALSSGLGHYRLSGNCTQDGAGGGSK